MVRPKRPKVKIQQEEQYTVEEIRNKKVVKGETFYFLKWLGWPESDNTWEPEQNLGCPDLIEAFEEAYKDKQMKKADEVSAKIKKGLLEEKGFSSTLVPCSSINNNNNNATEEEVDEEEEDVVAEEEEEGEIPMLQHQQEEEEEEEELVPKKRMRRENQLYFSDDYQHKIGFERGLKADRVIGAIHQEDELFLLVLWEGLDEAELIPARICNDVIPQLVISFYEERSQMVN